MSFKEDYGVFTQQTKTEHAAMVGGSLVIAHIIYLASMMVMGDVETLTEESTGAMYTRRNGMVVISVGTSLYFAAAYMRAIGGELLNLFYNLIVILFTPYNVAHLFGHVPEDLFTRGLYRGLLSDALPFIIFPGVVCPVLMLFLWPWSFDWRETDKTFGEWYEENMPEWDEENALDQGNNQS